MLSSKPSSGKFKQTKYCFLCSHIQHPTFQASVHRDWSWHLFILFNCIDVTFCDSKGQHGQKIQIYFLCSKAYILWVDDMLIFILSVDKLGGLDWLMLKRKERFSGWVAVPVSLSRTLCCTEIKHTWLGHTGDKCFLSHQLHTGTFWVVSQMESLRKTVSTWTLMEPGVMPNVARVMWSFSTSVRRQVWEMVRRFGCLPQKAHFSWKDDGSVCQVQSDWSSKRFVLNFVLYTLRCLSQKCPSSLHEYIEQTRMLWKEACLLVKHFGWSQPFNIWRESQNPKSNNLFSDNGKGGTAPEKGNHSKGTTEVSCQVHNTSECNWFSDLQTKITPSKKNSLSTEKKQCWFFTTAFTLLPKQNIQLRKNWLFCQAGLLPWLDLDLEKVWSLSVWWWSSV